MAKARQAGHIVTSQYLHIAYCCQWLTLGVVLCSSKTPRCFCAAHATGCTLPMLTCSTPGPLCTPCQDPSPSCACVPTTISTTFWCGPSGPPCAWRNPEPCAAGCRFIHRATSDPSAARKGVHSSCSFSMSRCHDTQQHVCMQQTISALMRAAWLCHWLLHPRARDLSACATHAMVPGFTSHDEPTGPGRCFTRLANPSGPADPSCAREVWCSAGMPMGHASGRSCRPDQY